MTTTAEEHLARLKRLMALEAEAEKQETLAYLQNRSPKEAEATGDSLINLIISAEDGGLGGHVLLTLRKRNQALKLPWTRLRSGTPVILSEEMGSQTNGNNLTGWRGVVSNLNRDNIQVALTTWPETEADRPTFRLDKANDEISRQRQSQALEAAQSSKETHLRQLGKILLGEQLPSFRPNVTYQPTMDNLNSSQQEAVRFALSANEIAIIHGPPGTGKTTTVVALIRQLTNQGQKVLACAPSNLAVDNLLLKLVDTGERVIRLGHPARVQANLQAHTLDALVKNHPDMRQVEKLQREAYALRNQAGKYTRAKPAPGAKQAMRREARQMLSDARRMEDQVVERLIDGADVLCATTTGLDRRLLGNRVFDWCIIDEAGQSTEPENWIPLQFSKRLVLAGDHCQLPPTVVSAEAAKAGFNISLLERLITTTEVDIARRLTTQYRMHTDIMTFSSQEFYEQSLQAHISVAHHLLSDLAGVISDDLSETAIHFIDTAGASYDEVAELGGTSRLNPKEATLALKKADALIKAGLSASDIAMIVPYAAQAKWLREQRDQPELEIDTVDGFQGREKEAIIVSLVRSNPGGEIGFLADVRRMNVALTRARRKLIVIGDSATITTHPFYARLVAYFESIGAYHSVWEEFA